MPKVMFLSGSIAVKKGIANVELYLIEHNVPVAHRWQCPKNKVAADIGKIIRVAMKGVGNG